MVTNQADGHRGYSRFRFKAVVDWIEVVISTAMPTHYDAIRRHGKLSFVEPLNAGPIGKTASVFRIRIHDPRNWADVTGTIATIVEKFPLDKPFEVVGIEVAFDAYTRDKEDPEALAALVADFTRFNSHENLNRRLFRRPGDSSYSPPSTHAALVRLFGDGWQLGVGDKNSNCYQHAYVKTTDHNKQPIPGNQHRARIEITLRGTDLPCTTNEAWSQCNFPMLARPYFSFRKLRTDLTAIEQVSADASLQIGKRCKRNRREGGTRFFSKITKADSILNGLARDKLRDLSDRWQRPKRSHGEGPREIAACGNSGRANTGSPCNHAETLANSDNYSSNLFSQFHATDASLLEAMFHPTPELETEQERINNILDSSS